MATDIVLRSVKAAPLTHAEMDQNWESLAQTVDAVTSNKTVAVTDQNKILECSITNGTITLPTVSAAAGTDTDSFRITIKNIDSTVLIVDGNGSELIDGAASINLTQFASVMVSLDGASAGWGIIASGDTYALAKTDGNFIVGDGTNWVAESGDTARISLGLGSTSSPTFANITSTGTVTTDDLTTTGNTILGNASSDTVNIGSGDIIKDGNGNVGIGVTPETLIGSGVSSLQVGVDQNLFYNAGNSYLGRNTYSDGTNFKYGRANVTPILYEQSDSGHIFKYGPIGSADATITFIDALTLNASGNAAFGGNVSLLDLKHMYLGGGNDLDIYHNGIDSYIDNITGILYQRQLVNGGSFHLQVDSSSSVQKDCIVMGGATPDVKLYYNGLLVMATVSNGVNFADLKHLYFGTGNDLDIFHDGGSTYFRNSTGNFFIEERNTSGLIRLTSYNSSDVLKTGIDVGGATPNVKLYYDGVQSCSTQSGGIAFNTDTAAANTLDDYEEGTFNITFAVAVGSITIDAVNDTLSYTKVGRMVHVIGRVGVSAVSGGPSGALDFNSLPFTPANLPESSEISAFDLTYNAVNAYTGTGVKGIVVASTTTVSLQRQTTNLNDDAGNIIAAGSNVHFNFTYFT